MGSSGCQAPVGQGHSHVGPDAPARVASALQLRPVPEPASSAGRWLGTPRPPTRPLALEALGDLAASPSEVPGNEGGHSTAPGGPGAPSGSAARSSLPRVNPPEQRSWRPAEPDPPAAAAAAAHGPESRRP